MQQALIALGANLGNETKSFVQVRDLLASNPRVKIVRCSSLYRTSPVGDDSGDEFVNAGIVLQTELTPLELLDCLLSIETLIGRERTVHWGPRVIDLDLIIYGNRIVRESRLNIPHPACWYRRFVLDPLVEIAPEALHPVKRRTLKELSTHLNQQPFRVSLAGGGQTLITDQFGQLVSQFPDIEFSQWNGATKHLINDPTILVWLGHDETQDEGDSGLSKFEDLPILPRLDLTESSVPPAKALRYVLESAFGRPDCIGPFPDSV